MNCAVLWKLYNLAINISVYEKNGKDFQLAEAFWPDDWWFMTWFYKSSGLCGPTPTTYTFSSFIQCFNARNHTLELIQCACAVRQCALSVCTVWCVRWKPWVSWKALHHLANCLGEKSVSAHESTVWVTCVPQWVGEGGGQARDHHRVTARGGGRVNFPL